MRKIESIQMDPVPVRIQAWLSDGVRLDIRAWLDELELTNEVPPLDVNPTMLRFYQASRHDASVKAHTDHKDLPWKFERGKPKAVA